MTLPWVDDIAAYGWILGFSPDFQDSRRRDGLVDSEGLTDFGDWLVAELVDARLKIVPSYKV